VYLSRVTTKASTSGARFVKRTTFARSSGDEVLVWGSWREDSSSAGVWAESGRRENILLISFFCFLGEGGFGSWSTLLALRFLEEPVRFFAAFRTVFEILASCWKIVWRSSGLDLDMLSMLARLAFWRAWTLDRAVAKGTLASWVRKRRRVGRSVGGLIALYVEGEVKRLVVCIRSWLMSRYVLVCLFTQFLRRSLLGSLGLFWALVQSSFGCHMLHGINCLGCR
jgi:hypothetical protein